MRVISGKYRGKNLKCLKGLKTRPTLGRVKESLFNIIQFEISGKNALDLFAGSGQLGIEALSRGAKNADFCEADKQAFLVLQSNFNGIFGNYRLFNIDYKNFLENLDNQKKYDIIFIDPPFDKNLYTDAITRALPFLNKDGQIICESAKDYVFDSFDKLTCNLEKVYGQTKLSFFKFK